MESTKPLIEQPEDNSSQAVLLYKEAVQYCIGNYGVKSKEVIDTNISINEHSTFTELYQNIVRDGFQSAPEDLRQYLIRNNCINDNVNKEFIRCVKLCYTHFEKYIKSIDLFTANIVGNDERENFIDLYQSLELAFDDRADVGLTLNSDKLIQFLRDKEIYVDKIIEDYSDVDDREVRQSFCFNELIKLYPDYLTYGHLSSLGGIEKDHLCDLFDKYLRSYNRDTARLEDYLLELGMLEVESSQLEEGYLRNICVWFSDTWVDYNSNEDGLENYNYFKTCLLETINQNRVVQGLTFEEALRKDYEDVMSTNGNSEHKDKILKYLVAKTLYKFNLLDRAELQIQTQQFQYVR